MPSKIERCWRRLTSSAGSEVRASRRCLDELVAAYGTHDRHYHGVEHIEALLAQVDAEGDHFVDRAAVELAVLFHDAVYDAHDPMGNEAASAALARERLTALDLDAALVDKVARFIEATAHFAGAAPPEDPDLARFLDLDLSILAASQSAYDAYAAAIRREYAHVPDADYRVGRCKVLHAFLARPRIFLCDDHHEAWDARARANLGREHVALTGSAQ